MKTITPTDTSEELLSSGALPIEGRKPEGIEVEVMRLKTTLVLVPRALIHFH